MTKNLDKKCVWLFIKKEGFPLLCPSIVDGCFIWKIFVFSPNAVLFFSLFSEISVDLIEGFESSLLIKPVNFLVLLAQL